MSHKILIVDDEGIIAEDLSSCVKGLGYTVAAMASRGEAAVKKAGEVRPDVVLMDIMLGGGMDGITAAELIKKQYGIPVIFVTAYADDSTLHRAKITEPYGYILKPFEARELHSSIEIAIYKSRVERQLQEKEHLLATTLHSIEDAVVTTDNNGVITFVNAKAELLEGWRLEEVKGKHLRELLDIFNNDTRQACASPIDAVLTEKVVKPLESNMILRTVDGREFPIEGCASPIVDESGAIMGVVLVFRDITEKQLLSDFIQRNQKLESLGKLAGGIAHDFNNLLAGIFGYLDLAIDAAAAHKADPIGKYLNKAVSVFDRAKGLTQQLLTFSKGGIPIRKTLKLTPLIRDSVKFALSGSNIDCHFEFAEDLWLCDCDGNQIAQVVDNIVINAKQAMPAGGTIAVSGRNVSDKQGHVGNFVEITIQDNGVGMPKEVITKIFDPFFTTKATGHGLGLAIVYSIVKRHDGWIDVESKPGIGTTFHIYLPASHKAESMGAKTNKELHEGAGKILIMDDEEFILEIVGSMIETMGYTVTLTKDGAEALALFTDAEQSRQPFVASILDMTVPGGLGGKEIAAAMRNINHESIIIASSGYSDDPAIAHPHVHGFTDSIVKPYRMKELSELMRRILPKQN